MKLGFKNVPNVYFKVALILALLLFFPILKLSNFVITGFRELEAAIYIPIIMAIISAAIGLFAALFTQSRIRLRAIEEAHR